LTTEIDVLKDYRIGVLAGGCSSERDISIKSGKAVFKALKKAGLETVFIDVREETVSFLDTHAIEMAFIALHGKFGEDGTMQEMLALKEVPYTGSDPEASAFAMDKLASKKRFVKNGLKVPDYTVVHSGDDMPDTAVHFPCVVKPRYEGSSIGITIVPSPEDLPAAVEKAMACGGSAIIEKYIRGRELTVGILQNEALPVVEVIASHGLYDFSAKYEDPDTEYVVPARIEREVYQMAQEIGVAAHACLGCVGFSRVDMRMDENGEIFVLEINTIPGLTEKSLLPKAARAAGIDFTELCVKILSSALYAKGAVSGEKKEDTKTEDTRKKIPSGQSS